MSAPLERPLICPIVVGRDRELAAAAALLDRARAGQGRVALVGGEAGIGKSRLAAEVRSLALDRGFSALRGRCFREEAADPYAPVLDLLLAFFAASPPRAERAQLAKELARLLPDLALALPDLAAPSPPDLPGPEQHRRRLFTLLARLLLDLAGQQPLLVVIEDAHWCDESSLDFFLHLARHGRERPILLLVTYRDDEPTAHLLHWLAGLDRERLASELPLRPLAEAEVAAMVRAILAGPATPPADLLAPIQALAEGNPFYVEELLASLLAAGDPRPIAGERARAAGARRPGAQPPIPQQVREVVRQRSALLSAGAARVLTLAAVAGRRFDLGLLQPLLGCDDDALLLALKELIAARFVVEESADRYAFRHALVQQAIAGALLARERRALHRAIADALDARHTSPAAREAHLTDLAHHAYAAESWGRALEYSWRLGERALALHAPGAAIAHLNQALDAAARVPVVPPGQVHLARGQAHATRGEFDRARDDFARALELGRRAADGALEWRAMMALGALWAGRDYAEAGAWFGRAGERATDLADQTLRARSLNRLGNWLVNTGRLDQGLAAHREALAIFEARQDLPGTAETLDLLGPAHGMRGERVAAVELLGRAVALFRALGDTASLITSLAMRAIQSMPGASETTLSPLRSRDDCVREAEEALALARQTESLAGQAFAGNALAHTLHTFGEFGPALVRVGEARRIAAEIGHKQWQIATAYDLGHLHLLLLDPDPAIAAAEAGLALARELGSRFWIATLAATLGQARLLRGDLPAAEVLLRSVLPREQHPRNMAERTVALAWGELALAQGAPDVALALAERLLTSVPGLLPGQPAQPIPHLLKLRGDASLALGRVDAAAAALEGARRGARERGMRPLLWSIRRDLGRAYRLLRRDADARGEFAAARQLIEELAATIEVGPPRDRFRRAALATLPAEGPPSPREVARRAFDGLTPREREVAALVARGLTSREIAAALVVSERTAEVHVGNILGKLGFTSRAQIAAWAVERGLAKP